MSTIFYKFFLRAQFFVKVICCGKFHPAVSAPKAAKRYRTQKRARRRCCPTTHTGETTKAVAALARHPSQDRPRLKSSRSDKRPPHRAYHKNNRSIKNATPPHEMGGSTQTRAKKADGFAQEQARRNTAAHPHAAKSPRTKILSSVKCSRRTSPAVRTSLYTAPAPYTSYPAARTPMPRAEYSRRIPLPPPIAGCPAARGTSAPRTNRRDIRKTPPQTSVCRGVPFFKKFTGAESLFCLTPAR